MSQWVVREQSDKAITNKLSNALEVPLVIAQILVNRGISTVEDAKHFFDPKWEDLYDPFLMKDMDRAVERIVKAIQNKERIFIYGDYDVDGITSVSLLYLFLIRMGCEVFFYIPDRLREGYGLSEQGIHNAKNVEATLLISVDCGITGVEEVALASSLGIDVIVSDHHEAGTSLPDAVAILDPKRDDCSYPFIELAGVGVAFKLVQAVTQQIELSGDVC